jgi:hypothetical protein
MIKDKKAISSLYRTRTPSAESGGIVEHVTTDGYLLRAANYKIQEHEHALRTWVESQQSQDMTGSYHLQGVETLMAILWATYNIFCMFYSLTIFIIYFYVS